MEHNDWMDGPNPEPEQEIDDIIRSARQDFQGGGAQRGPVDPSGIRTSTPTWALTRRRPSRRNRNTETAASGAAGRC